jgi:hypothetical protein
MVADRLFAVMSVWNKFLGLAAGVTWLLGLCQVQAAVPPNGLLREVWEGIPGEALSALTDSPSYPDYPTSTNYVTDLFEAPIDVMEAYGQRMHGYVLAPLTGAYTFWISSDDNGALYLSTDENPANAQLIAWVASWTPSRQWAWEPNQQSAPVSLVAGRPYYVSALMKEGGGGDNLAVRWLMPNGIDQAPMIATNLLPYGVTFQAPAFAQHPTNTTAVEGGTARFMVQMSGVGLYSFQWQRNGSPIPGANQAELVYGPVAMTDQDARFRCVATNSLGKATSNEGVLTVSPDTTPPLLLGARNQGLSQVEVTFSEAVAAPSATTTANYRLTGGVNVTSAAFGASPNVVLLGTSPLTLGAAYTLTVTGVTDRAQTPNPIAPGANANFVVVEYTPQDIGAPPLAGGTTPVVGGADVRGSGDIGGQADSCQFAWVRRTGDFDMRGRLSAFDPTDPFAKAGLMARDTLAAGSRFAAALATPATVGCFFLSRGTENGTATRSGFFPSNYPDTWLRLKRAGNVFTAYAGYDGLAWTQLGSATLALSNSVYFGLAVASRNAAALAAAAFRDLGTVSSATVVPYTPVGESLGPSSRQTPLVISEIMYHPPERPDGLSGEFVEFYNGDLIGQDLTGYRLSGTIEYAFPDGFILPAGGFALVARKPADLASIYGLPMPLGPFAGTDSLANSAGTLRLRNPQGAVLLEVNYDSRPPWPAAADGAGHSLVLARPSYGEGDPRAWAASDRVGGSPGRMESVRSNPHAALCINEFLAHTDPPQLDFVELLNRGTQSVDLSGCVLTDDPATNRYRLRLGTFIGPRAFVWFDEEELGFRLNAAGETLWLLTPDGTRVIDAVKFGPQESGVATGRSPDGSPGFRRLTEPSPGAENLPFAPSPVVINEIMYHPVSGDDNDEFVELHNPWAQAVDLSGWRFSDGIAFTFPAGARLAPQGYVAIAKNRARLLANYPAVDPALVFGDFAGTLANNGERLALAKPDWIVTTNEFGLRETNRIYIDVDEVVYGTGGRWGQWSDGLGSSLELIDPQSDHLRAANWADSDESAKAPWCTIEYTGRLDNGDGGSANRLQIMMQGPGECLVDDVEVLPATGGNRLTNPGFTQGATGWTSQGNHRRSTVDPTGGVGNTACLHVRTTGRGDTACNRIYAAINPALAVNQNGTLRARVRWLKGWPEFLLRVRGSYLEAAGRLALPTNLGTPAARNSRALANAGPAIFDVTHAPVIPAANETVLVTARVSDPDGLNVVRLRYRVDPSATVNTITMKDDGTGGDAMAGDDLFSARLPSRAAGTLVAFYVEATDAKTSGASTALFPADAPAHECLVRWGDPKPFGNLGIYRLWQRQADYNALRNREPLANDNLDATFAYNDGRIIYNIEMRAKGSPWHGGSVGSDYVLAFPEDDRFLGARDLALVTVGNLGSDDSLQREQAAFWIGRQMGVPTLHRRHVFFFENGVQKQQVYEDTEEPNGLYADRWWPEGQDGDLYKIEDWFEFDDGGSSFTFSRDATLEKFTTTGGALKLARYRWAWRKRAVVDSANNYTNFFNLVTAANLTGTALVTQMENLVDVENWMRIFALQHVVGNWDAYGYSRGKNGYIYKPIGQRFGMVPWDIDFVLGSGSDGTGTDVFGANDPVISSLWNNFTFRRVYLRAFLDAIAGPLQNTNFDPLVDARYAALTANGLSPANPRAIKTWVTARRNYLANRVAALDTPTFAITSNGGSDFNSAQAVITLAGTAPLAIKTITVNGLAVPVTWSTVTGWTMSLALGARTNVLQLAGLNSRGQLVAGAADTITVRYTGADLPSPAGQVVINEIMYHPPIRNGSFLELLNISPTTSFDLSGWQLDGVGYTFPNGTIFRPGQFLVVAEDRDAFAAQYGFAVLPVGEFPGTLQNNGERLRLIKPGAAPATDIVVDEVRYAADLPWPPAADGGGSSLQLRDAQQDNWRAGNWAPASPTPGLANTVAASLAPFPPLFLNETLPQNPGGATDRFGEADPWVELFNAGTNALDLSGLYLTANYSNLTQWAFPAGTTLGPQAFMLVWADAEPGQSTPGELHTNFRLDATNGAVALVRYQLGAPAVMDCLNYRNQPAGLSYGSYPDGQPQERRLFHLPTPGQTNTPGAPPIQVFINEWMASNTGVVLDPADNDADDWFELYNAGPAVVELSGYTLTDVLTNTTKFVLPNGTIIPAGGFLLVWADEEPGQATNGQVHADFKLSGGGEAIGLFAPDGTPVDTVTFGPQTNNISEGRFPDAMPEPFVFMVIPTPGQPNRFATANHPPVLEPIGTLGVDEGQTISFTAQATDQDPDQHLVFTLLAAPPAASLDPATGQFRWTTTEADGPGDYAFVVRVTDDGVPPRWDSETVHVLVRELNQPPTLDPLADQTVPEGLPVVFRALAHDADLPAQRLRFRLEPGAPEGAVIDEFTGDFTWTPTEAQGGVRYTIGVRVTDDGQPPLVAVGTCALTVAEVDNAPEFTPVGLQLTDELVPFVLNLHAEDPDSPPRPVTYLLESGPSGLRVDAATGVLTWTPTEEQGPNSYNVVVRASEVGGTLSATLAFSIVVNEKNQAPTLAPIPDWLVSEGALLVFTNTATDADLPPQRLAFTLAPGAPPAASIDAASGVFTWPIGEDVGPSTNQITVRVTDDALQALTTARLFTVQVLAYPRVVINEIMYRPPTGGVAFVELHNWSTNTTWDLGGWRLTGMEFAMPSGTSLAPGAYLAVAKDVARFKSVYGNSLPVIGDLANRLGPNGGAIALWRPLPDGTTGLVDRVAFRTSAPWPTQANGGGPSLQRIDPSQDGAPVANWAAVSGTTTNAPINVVPIEGTWRYWQSASDPAAGWTGRLYNDSAWPSGKGLLYVEGSALPAPKSTPLTLGQMSYLFRAHFNFTGNPEGASLRLNTVIDDGVVFYLNGTAYYWLGMTDGVIPTRTAPASRLVDNAIYEGPFTFTVTNLVNGDNVIAAEVHQNNSGSSDIVMGASVDVLEVKRESATPGRLNSVRATLEPFPTICLNEVQALNVTGPKDAAGDRDPWIELSNYSAASATLTNCYLSDSFTNLGRWPFPAGARLAPGQFRLVWADGEPGESSDQEWHASFRLAAPAGIVVLSRLQRGQLAIVDYLEYANLSADQSFGYPDPRTADTASDLLPAPTPAAPNRSAPPPAPQILDLSIAESGQCTLRWSTTAGYLYRLEVKTDLTLPDWSLVGQVRAAGPETTLTDPGAPGSSIRFYRVVGGAFSPASFH